ncbi:hydrolase [Pontimicrobium sp. MEBiC01747]
MKNRIFMYLFIFSLLLLLFQFINSKNIFDDSNQKVADYKAKIENYKEDIKKYKDSIENLNGKVYELSQFSMNGNEPAITYFLNQGYKVDNVLSIVEDELYELNFATGEHPLVPYASSEGNKMLISGIRILNHKWVIASFTDNQFNGELFITYNFNDKGELKFNLEDSFLYPLE